MSSVGIRTQGRRMVGADEPTGLPKEAPPILPTFVFYSDPLSFNC